MADRQQFLLLPSNERKEILQTVGAKIGVNPAVLEKDIWVCWALRTLFSIPNTPRMAFKGGTSLSKAYGLIDRFSEDIDITLDYRQIVRDIDPFALSRTKRDELTKTLRKKLAEFLKQVVVPSFSESLKKEFGESDYRVELDPESPDEVISLFYKPLFQVGYRLDHVVLEFGGRNAIEPQEVQAITSTLAAHVDLEFPMAEIPVLAAERTFWEKATLIHVECHVEAIDRVNRKSRHWFDLYKLSLSKHGDKALTDISLLQDVLKFKTAFFNSSKANYEACGLGQLKLVPSENMGKELEKDFQRMRDEGMFAGNAPAFAEILDALKGLERTMNAAIAESLKKQEGAGQ